MVVVGMTPTGRRWGRAATAGAVTALWHALPDHLATRRSRVWVKALLASAVVTWSLVRSGWSAAEDGDPPVPGAPAGSAPAQELDAPTTDGRVTGVGAMGAAVFISLVVGGLVGSVALTASADRAVYQLGERAARRGARFPHTLNGAVLGVIAGLMALISVGGGRRERASSH